ncbi:MAG: hypothetical protein IT381_22505 [Deltaproteobacteria bacterium]|nr:hypothetical protein [Deltaproteobacteria bacterium]
MTTIKRDGLTPTLETQNQAIVQTKDAKKKEATKRASEIDAAKFVDMLQRANGVALLKSLEQAASADAAPGRDKHAFAALFEQLVPLMGDPGASSTPIGAAFSPEALALRAKEGAVLGLESVKTLLDAIDGKGQTFATLQQQLEARAGFSGPAAFAKTQTILAGFFEKAALPDADAAIAHLPETVQQAFRTNSGPLVDASDALFRSADAASQQAKAGQEIILPNAAVLAVENALGPIVAATRRQTSAPAAKGAAFVGVELSTADIESLIYWIMMQSASSATEELREVMKDLQGNLKAKKAQREKLRNAKENKARVDGEMRREYDKLLSAGVIKSTYTFEQYSAWRKVACAEDGRAQLSPLDYSALPKIATEGPEAALADDAAVVGAMGPVPQLEGVTSLKDSDAQAFASQFGVYPSDIQYLWAAFMAPPGLTDPAGGRDFSAFLKGSVGLAPASGDPVVTATNAQKVSQFFTALVSSGEVADAEALQRAQAEQAAAAAAARGVTVEESAANLAEMELLLQQVAVLELIASSSSGSGAALDAARTNLTNTVLKKPLTPEDEALLKEFQSVTLPAQLDELSNYVQALVNYFDGNVSNKIEDMEAWMDSGASDDDNKAYLSDYGWNGSGPYFVWGQVNYDGSNESGSFTHYMPGSADGRNHDYISNHMDVYGSNDHNEWLGAWPDPNIALFDVMTSMVAKTGVAINESAELRNLIGNASAQAAHSRGTVSYAYAGPGSQPGDVPELVIPPASAATQLAAGWQKQHQLDLTHTQAEEARKEQERKEAEAKEAGAKAFADGVAKDQEKIEIDSRGLDQHGDAWRMLTVAEFGADIEKHKDALDGMNDLGEPLQMRLQQYMERRSKAFETLSNLMKKLMQTADTIQGNIK